MAKRGDPKTLVLNNFEELKFVDNIFCPQRGQLRLFRFHPFAKYMVSKLVCSVPVQQMDVNQQQQLLKQYKERCKIKQPHIFYTIESESQKTMKPGQFGQSEVFQIFVFFEYGQLTLHELTERRQAKRYLIPEPEVWCLIKGVMQAMHFFQNNNIPHGMITTKTIYFDEEYLLYRVYDQELIGGRWGNFIKYQQTKDPEIQVFLAPETKPFINSEASLLETAQINPFKVDVFAFGIVLLQCLTLFQAFENPLKWLDQFYSKNLMTFITQCIQPDPNKRQDWIGLYQLPLEPSQDQKINERNSLIQSHFENRGQKTFR
ncbi:unnamed protein product [Paramecium pentaurelia]|uniref:Protein kinase domain-containing protein n=1 Tax=Paramecium pentaurelia TaxID=43138 RepID=A0A8S1UWS8_9CILI|nr:unnamed protein product [Paramecium pentaurelia]